MTRRTIDLVALKGKIRVEVSDGDRLGDIIDTHYIHLATGEPPPLPVIKDSWQCCDPTTLASYRLRYPFILVDRARDPVALLHPADRICRLSGTELTVWPRMDFSSDDSISFYLFEREDALLPLLVEAADLDAVKEALFRFHEKMLMEPEAFLMLDNFIRHTSQRSSAVFLEHQVPSGIWGELRQPYMNYYLHFILRVVTELSILNHCLDNRNSSNNIVRESARRWVADYLYRVQTVMLVLLSIPEVYLRNVEATHYFKGLRKLGIAGFTEIDKGESYFKAAIVGRTVKQIYTGLLTEAHVETYSHYLDVCQDRPPSDLTIGKAVHTFRILYNKLKHASYVRVQESRDHETPYREGLARFDEQIRRLKMTLPQTPRQEKELFELEAKREVFEKVRYALGHLDWESADFKRENGITVGGGKEGEWFRISLYDLEYILRLLVGILIVLSQAKALSNSRINPTAGAGPSG
ncbi:hypothetical protein MYX78_05305 [Acidobacteria bacterium AH-259-G07]|nr:hypothetical protein [Acidobacteria bacterium AH-259-G07]